MLIYAAIGTVGFLILLVMLVFGDVGGDHDVGGHDAAFDHVDGDHGGPGIFSVRVMAAFLTAFGVGGVVGSLRRVLTSRFLWHRRPLPASSWPVPSISLLGCSITAGVQRSAHVESGGQVG